MSVRVEILSREFIYISDQSWSSEKWKWINRNEILHILHGEFRTIKLRGETKKVSKSNICEYNG